jgi:hypothetical protein
LAFKRIWHDRRGFSLAREQTFGAIAMKIMKIFWKQQQDGVYAIVDMKGLDLF